MDIKGQVAVITGGASGLGAATAQAFVNAGAKIALLDINLAVAQQMSDEGELVALVKEIIDANPEQAQQYRDGKTKVIGFFVGQLMQKTKGKANPQMANKLFSQELK